MQYYNLKVLVTLKQQIQEKKAYEQISKLISSSMLKDEKLKKMHEKNQYKNYVFCNLYPIEKEGLYQIGRIYTFDVRFNDLNLAMKMKQCIESTETEFLKVIISKLENSCQKEIKKIISLTPAVITTSKGDFLINNDLELVKTRILANTQKKYNQIYETKVDIDFIKEIKQKNEKPIKIPYKNINILGNKFEITINNDPMSQNLAYLILSIGLLEKNAEGFGFCKAI